MEIECTKRIYRIQTSEGIIMEIEVNKPLSEISTAKLIEEDNLGALLNSKIISVEMPKKEIKKIKKGPRLVRKLKKEKSEEYKEPEEKEQEKKEHEEQEPAIKSEGPEVLAGEKEKFLPSDRINLMIKMEGEFTRGDYQKMVEGSGHKISNFMGHDDIKDAILLGRIEHTGGSGNINRRYKVIDTEPVDKLMFRNIVKTRRDLRRRRKVKNKRY